MSLKSDLLAVYETLPKLKNPQKCAELCKTGKCKFECCTITGCSIREKHLINKHIAKNKLDLPYITFKHGMGYVLPAIDEKMPKCAYLTEKGCAIYEIRPAICRLFGAVKQMPCTHMPDEAKTDEYPLEAMVRIGMLTEAQYEAGLNRGGIDLFNKIMQGDNGSAFRRLANKIKRK